MARRLESTLRTDVCLFVQPLFIQFKRLALRQPNCKELVKLDKNNCTDRCSRYQLETHYSFLPKDLRQIAFCIAALLIGLFWAALFSTTVMASEAFTPTAITSLTLINADTNQPIADFDPLTSGAVLNLRSIGRNLNIRANVDSSTSGSVYFDLDNGSQVHTENVAPFAFAGDINGNYKPWTPTVGNHRISVIAYSEANRNGTASSSFTINFTVINDNGDAPAEPTAVPSEPTEPTNSTGGTMFVEEDGLVVMEAERGIPQTDDQWDVETAVSDYRGDGYIRWNGPNYFGDRSHGVLTYPIRITKAGTYHLRLRSFHDPESEGETRDQQNDAWTSGFLVAGELTSSTLYNTFRQSRTAGQPWNFETQWEPTHGNFQMPKYTLNPGEYVFTLAARSKHFMIDRIYLYHNDYGQAAALDPNQPESTQTASGNPTEPPTEPPAETPTDPETNPSGEGYLDGTLIKWQPLTLSFTGPFANEGDDSPNPFLDYRLQVIFTGPAGQRYSVPGFFAGDGNGGGSGNVWQVRFAADQAGEWSYRASFRSGDDVAIALAPTAGTATSFDNAGGTLTIADIDTSAPGFLKWGRLTYADNHYLKFADGPYWIKGGVDSPENLFGYADFDNTVDQGCKGIIHKYRPHVADWRDGDPIWVGESGNSGLGKGIIGALNYLSSQRVNSIYFLPMNLGGDGCDTYPFIDANGSFHADTHYDISKLEQWRVVLEHAQEKGIALNVVLNETERNNERWLDDGRLGIERKLFYRELIARFSHLLAIKWNLSEENDFSDSELDGFADYISQLDWANHQITAHTHPNKIGLYDSLRYNPNFDATSIQYNPNNAGKYVETMRQRTQETGRPWAIDMDENSPAGDGLNDGNAVDLRKRVLYDVYFSGGNVEWYFGYHDLPLGGDLKTENFRTREEMYGYMGHARRLLQEQMPFWEMDPNDDLLSGEDGRYGGGEVFAKAGDYYALYLPDASNSNATLNLRNAGGEFEKRWFNPRNGQFEGATETISGGTAVVIGSPPTARNQDWVLFFKRSDLPNASIQPALNSIPDPAPGGGTVTLREELELTVYLPLMSSPAVARESQITFD